MFRLTSAGSERTQFLRLLLKCPRCRRNKILIATLGMLERVDLFTRGRTLVLRGPRLEASMVPWLDSTRHQVPMAIMETLKANSAGLDFRDSTRSLALIKPLPRNLCLARLPSQASNLSGQVKRAVV